MLKRILLTSLAVLVLLLVVVGVKTWLVSSRRIAASPAAPITIDAQGAARRLAGALRFRTIASADDATLNADQFRAFHDYLREQFPNAHRVMTHEVVADLSLLYTWHGRDVEAPPILFLAHQDVVPVAPGTEKDWTVDAFGGAVRDGFVWGRGALDDKSSLLAQMEAVERLAAAGLAPRRTILLAFGADEEVGGERGAGAIAQLLRARGLEPAFSIDEGSMITQGIMPGVSQPIALIGVAEKGRASLALHVEAEPGHGALPPSNGSAIGILATALTRIADRPMPARLGSLARDTLSAMAPEMPFASRVAMANLWLFAPIVRAQMQGTPGPEQMLRTGIAFTRIHAGERDNVLPGRADAVINCRLLPGDSIAELTAHVTRAVDEPRVEIRVLPGAREASRITRHDTPEYHLVETTIREQVPAAIIAPGLVIGGTDSVHYRDVSASAFRFLPIELAAGDLERMHGTDERVSVEGHADMIRFYERLMRRAAGPDVPHSAPAAAVP